MISRISDNTRLDSVVGNLSLLQGNLGKVLDQLTTQKKINRPSDDPQGMTAVLGLRSAGASIAQYRTNVSQSRTWLNMTQTTLEGVSTLLAQVEVVLQDLEGASPAERLAAADSLQGLGDQFYTFASAELNGQYLFSGSLTGTEPFASGVTGYQGNTQSLEVNVGQNYSLAHNITGDEVFTFDDGAGGVDDLFGVLEGLQTVLQNPASSEADIEAAAAELKNAVEQVKTNVADSASTVDTVLTRLEFTENHLADMLHRVETQLSLREDADVAELAASFQMQLLALNASYTAATKIEENSLLKFLR
jgi:flagellar hook-associated protein 3 FlgL